MTTDAATLSMMKDLRELSESVGEIVMDYPKDVRGFMTHTLLDAGMIKMGHKDESYQSFRYQCYQDLLLDLAPAPRRVPLIITPELDRPRYTEPSGCYSNAFHAVMDFDHLTYCEGFAQTTTLIVRHAWLELDDGTIVDPTWARLPKAVRGTRATFWGLRFTTDFLRLRSEETGYTSIFDSEYLLDKPLGFRSLRRGLTLGDDGIVIDEGEV